METTARANTKTMKVHSIFGKLHYPREASGLAGDVGKKSWRQVVEATQAMLRSSGPFLAGESVNFLADLSFKKTVAMGRQVRERTN